MKESFASDGFRLCPLGVRCDYLHQLFVHTFKPHFLVSLNLQPLLISKSQDSEN